MMHKAWCCIEEVPYYFWGHQSNFKVTDWKINDLNPIWVRLLGRLQLLNPSDLPCLNENVWISLEIFFNQWCLGYWHIYASVGLNELTCCIVLKITIDIFTFWIVSWNCHRHLWPETQLSCIGGEQNNRKWVQICLGGWLLTVDCIVHLCIYGHIQQFNPLYLPSILYIGILETPGGRLNKKDGLTRYGNSHVKDKTS